MNEQNDKEKRFSSLLSSVQRQTHAPDRQFLDDLRAKSTAEFATHSANGGNHSEKAAKITWIWRTIMKSRITKLGAAAMVIIAALIIVYQLDSSKEAIETGQTEGPSSSGDLGDLSLAQQVARSSAIVRATLEEITDTCSRWRVLRVLYGSVNEDLINVHDCFAFTESSNGRSQRIEDWKKDLEDRKGRELTIEEIWEELCLSCPWTNLGKEVILYLRRSTSGREYVRMGSAYDVPPNFPLDDYEEKIRRVIESGAHKTAPAEDGRL
jgi:hypothetical protein